MSESNRTLKFSRESIEAFVANVDENPIHRGSNAVVPGFLISAWAKQASDNEGKLLASDARKFAWQRSVMKRPIRAGDELTVKLDSLQEAEGILTIKWVLYNNTDLAASSAVVYRPITSEVGGTGPLTISFWGHTARIPDLCDEFSYCVSLASKAFANLLMPKIAIGPGKAIIFRSQEITAYKVHKEAHCANSNPAESATTGSQDHYTVNLDAKIEKVKSGLYTVLAVGTNSDRAKMFEVRACLAIVDKERLE